jgi:hypothetical protein
MMVLDWWWSYRHELSYVFASTMAWAGLHALVVRALLRPLAHRFIGKLPRSLKDARRGRNEHLRKTGKPKVGYFEDLKMVRFKFETAAWRLLTYTTLALTGWLLLVNSAADWLWDVRSYYSPDRSLALCLYYWLEFGHYLYGTVAIFFEPKMKDRQQMFLHHCVTLLLLATSYVGDKMRYGAVIMLLHDVSDPLLELGKLSLYLDRTGLSHLAFMAFTGVFIYTRNWLLPMRIIYEGVYPYKGIYALWWPTFLSLCTLAAMHVIWSSLILRVLWSSIFKGEGMNDIREEE